MNAENPTPEEAPVKRRGPRKESEIRAEVEAQVRAEMEANLRAEMEDEVRKNLESELRAQAAEDARIRAMASEATPISGEQISDDPTKDGARTYHFVDDGLTLLGKVWYRGEELTITPGTEAWEVAYPVLSLNEFEQEDRWGKRFIREGLWRGKRLDEIDDPELTPEERAALQKAAQIRDERFRIAAR
jgi:hypothetical protein